METKKVDVSGKRKGDNVGKHPGENDSRKGRGEERQEEKTETPQRGRKGSVH